MFSKHDVGNIAFCIVALTSSSVPPFLFIVLPRYVNVSVSSSGSPFSVMGLLFFVLAFIIFVLLLLMLSPSCVDTVALFCPASVYGCVRGERGHPRSPGSPTGSMVSTGSHFFFMIHSKASMNRNGDKRHPCLTPVFTMKESVSCPA